MKHNDQQVSTIHCDMIVFLAKRTFLSRKIYCSKSNYERTLKISHSLCENLKLVDVWALRENNNSSLCRYLLSIVLDQLKLNFFENLRESIDKNEVIIIVAFRYEDLSIFSVKYVKLSLMIKN